MTTFVSLFRISDSALTLKEVFSNTINVLQLSFTVMQERHKLRHLSPEMLKDIGISAEDALVEAERDPWDLPSERVGKC